MCKGDDRVGKCFVVFNISKNTKSVEWNHLLAKFIERL